MKEYNSPIVQVVFLGIVCLCCPGMFNALSGLGAGGSMSSNIGLIDAANGALYGCFAIVGFFAGSVTNTVGVKHTLTVNKILGNLHTHAHINLFLYSLVRLVTLFILQPCGCTTVSKYLVLLLLQAPF